MRKQEEKTNEKTGRKDQWENRKKGSRTFVHHSCRGHPETADLRKLYKYKDHQHNRQKWRETRACQYKRRDNTTIETTASQYKRRDNTTIETTASQYKRRDNTTIETPASQYKRRDNTTITTKRQNEGQDEEQEKTGQATETRQKTRQDQKTKRPRQEGQGKTRQTTTEDG